MIEFIIKIPLDKQVERLAGLFIVTPAIELHHSNADYELMLWGDPVAGDDFIKKHSGKIDHSVILSGIYGHYYYLLLDKTEGIITAGNSLFSILPIYYNEGKDNITLSNNALDLGKYLGYDVISRRFILETMLFNYPLFNQSIIESVMLVPSNSCITVSSGVCRLMKHTRIEEYFSEKPQSWRVSRELLGDFFLETVKKYLPSEKYINSLTGGFDSRTLVAAGMMLGRDFICSGFGAEGSKDIVIAENVSAKTGIPYREIVLGEQYVREESLGNGYEFIRNASGTASFIRAHYLYAAKILQKHSHYMITGNFGSELFRAAHVRGVVFSPNLITLFSSENKDEALKQIEACSEFSYLNKDTLTSEWEQLKQDISGLPCFDHNYKHLSLNQRFYVFVFEEVFRKYFGAEMVNQYKYLKNRTPYLDIEFLKALLDTRLAGVHSAFFEHNPFRRYKGQVLYAHIIRKAYPDLGAVITDKGYRPDDLMRLTGQVNILRGYLKKKSGRSASSADPYSALQAFRQNSTLYRQIPVDSALFNAGILNDEVYNKPGNELYKVISLSAIKHVIERHTEPGSKLSKDEQA